MDRIICNLVQGGDGGAARLAQAPLHLAKLHLVLLALLVLPAAPGHRLRQRFPRRGRFHLSFTFFACAGKGKSRPLELCGGRDARTDDTSYFGLLRGWGLLLLLLLLLAPCPVLLTLLLGRTHLAVVAQVHLGGGRKMSLIKAPLFDQKLQNESQRVYWQEFNQMWEAIFEEELSVRGGGPPLPFIATPFNKAGKKQDQLNWEFWIDFAETRFLRFWVHLDDEIFCLGTVGQRFRGSRHPLVKRNSVSILKPR